MNLFSCRCLLGSILLLCTVVGYGAPETTGLLHRYIQTQVTLETLDARKMRLEIESIGNGRGLIQELLTAKRRYSNERLPCIPLALEASSGLFKRQPSIDLAEKAFEWLSQPSSVLLELRLNISDPNGSKAPSLDAYVLLSAGNYPLTPPQLYGCFRAQLASSLRFYNAHTSPEEYGASNPKSLQAYACLEAAKSLVEAIGKEDPAAGTKLSQALDWNKKAFELGNSRGAYANYLIYQECSQKGLWPANVPAASPGLESPLQALAQEQLQLAGQGRVPEACYQLAEPYFEELLAQETSLQSTTSTTSEIAKLEALEGLLKARVDLQNALFPFLNNAASDANPYQAKAAYWVGNFHALGWAGLNPDPIAARPFWESIIFSPSLPLPQRAKSALLLGETLYQSQDPFEKEKGIYYAYLAHYFWGLPGATDFWNAIQLSVQMELPHVYRKLPGLLSYWAGYDLAYMKRLIDPLSTRPQKPEQKNPSSGESSAVILAPPAPPPLPHFALGAPTPCTKPGEVQQEALLGSHESPLPSANDSVEEAPEKDFRQSLEALFRRRLGLPDQGPATTPWVSKKHSASSFTGDISSRDASPAITPHSFPADPSHAERKAAIRAKLEDLLGRQQKTRQQAALLRTISVRFPSKPNSKTGEIGPDSLVQPLRHSAEDLPTAPGPLPQAEEQTEMDTAAPRGNLQNQPSAPLSQAPQTISPDSPALPLRRSTEDLPTAPGSLPQPQEQTKLEAATPSENLQNRPSVPLSQPPQTPEKNPLSTPLEKFEKFMKKIF